MEHIRVKFLKGLGQVFPENSDVEGILNGVLRYPGKGYHWCFAVRHGGCLAGFLVGFVDFKGVLYRSSQAHGELHRKVIVDHMAGVFPGIIHHAGI